MIYLKLLRESFIFAFNELKVNKVRTFLSLLGITIGIFSVIAVFTIFDSMEIYLRNSINSLGSNVLFVQKWPWMGGENLEWWKIMNRNEPSLDDLDAINKKSELKEAASYMAGTNKTLKNGNNIMKDISIEGVSYDYPKIMSLEIQSGRFFTELEANNGRNVTLIGSDVADNLFPGIDPIGKNIQVGGYKTYVIGVMKKKGDNAFGNSPDKTLMIPVNYIRNFVNLRRSGGTIAVLAKSGISNEQLRDELTGILRSEHRLKPGEEDDFAINETSVISKTFDVFFGVIATVGWVIGGFSLLVGGFGIANIMFVSVKERVNIIGIQKAMGAKNFFILFQFLFEAIMLALIGGIVGLLIVFLLVVIVNAIFDFGMVLTLGNIILGVSVSSIIGLVSGFLPAFQASKLDPVEAMRSLS